MVGQGEFVQPGQAGTAGRRGWQENGTNVFEWSDSEGGLDLGSEWDQNRQPRQMLPPALPAKLHRLVRFAPMKSWE